MSQHASRTSPRRQSAGRRAGGQTEDGALGDAFDPGDVRVDQSRRRRPGWSTASPRRHTSVLVVEDEHGDAQRRRACTADDHDGLRRPGAGDAVREPVFADAPPGREEGCLAAEGLGRGDEEARDVAEGEHGADEAEAEA